MVRLKFGAAAFAVVASVLLFGGVSYLIAVPVSVGFGIGVGLFMPR